MPAVIVNSRHVAGRVTGVAPSYGYLLMGASIAPPNGPPLVRPNRERSIVLHRLAEHIHPIRRLEPVVRATIYRAVLIPPGQQPPFRPNLEPPRFDVMVLIETDSPGSAERVANSAPVVTTRNLLRKSAARLAEMQARCVRAMADVDKRAAGIYLFNFWAAASTTTAVKVWEHLAPWFQSKTGLQNSTVLQPLAGGDFAFVNHARWDTGPVGIAAHQFLRPSFYTFVRRNLAANHIHVYPALYRKA
jgi:hypothetical protein